MRRKANILVAALVLIGAVSPATAESAGVLLEKGVFLQETKGDLDAAMKIYKQIVADPKADRKHVASAQYRLGMCFLQKKQFAQAEAAFKDLIADFPKEAKLVAKAREAIVQCRKRITGPALARIVKEVVMTISTCAEYDPRVKQSLESLKGLNEQAVVKAVMTFLDSEQATVRRSAIYILWKGDFASIDPAVEALKKLCKHTEGLTRGMAGIALGGRKIDSSFQVLCDMTLKDKSAYARRCAAYALGLLGRTDARGVLKKALADKEAFVRNNAEAALTILDKAAAIAPAGPAFGPVIERVIFDLDDGRGNEGLALESGKLFNLAPEFGQASARPLSEWIESRGIDLFVEYAKNRWALMTGGLKLTMLPNDRWNDMKAVDVAGKAAAPELGIEVLERSGFRYYLLKKGASPPVTFAFKTRAGRLGLMRIVALGKNPRSVKIRYKLVAGGSAVGGDDQLPAQVMAYIIDQHMAAYKRGNAKGLRTNTHIYGVDAQFAMAYGGLITFRNDTANPIAGEVGVGNFSYSDLIVYDETGRTKNFRLVDRGKVSGGKHRLFWTPPRPVKPGEVQVIGWKRKQTTALPKVAGGHRLKMQNRYGSTVMENFFLVVPADLDIATESLKHASRKRIGQFDIYLYRRKVPAGTTNTVEVVLRARDAKGAVQAKAPLPVGPAPWADGEELYMSLKSPAGADLGAAVTTMESATVGGRKVWRMRARYLIAGMLMRSQVVVDRDSALPVSSQIAGDQVGDLRTDYSGKSIVWKIDKAGQKSSRTVEVEGTVYDDEQVGDLIRRLPLAKGYKVAIAAFSTQNGLINRYNVEVVGKEKVSVPAGEFDCHKVHVDASMAGVKMQFKFWLTADRHRYPVKVDAHAMVMELKRIGVKAKDEAKPVTFKDAKRGISLSAPAGWFFHGMGEGSGWMLFLLSPRMDTLALLARAEHSGGLPGSREAAEGDIKALKRTFKDYTVRAKSWAAPTISGIAAASYVADYVQQGRKMVEYRTYIRGKSTVHWFVFRVEKDKFAANRAAYDSIVKSLKVNDVPAAAKGPAKTLADRAWRQWGQRKFAEAEKLFKQAVETDAKLATAWNGLGWARFNQGNRAGAKTAFEKCLALEPKHAGALNGLGWIAKALGKTSEAIAHWQKAVAAEPTGTAALNGLATTHLELKQYDKAVKYYEMWLKVDPANADARAGLKRAKAAGKEKPGD